MNFSRRVTWKVVSWRHPRAVHRHHPHVARSRGQGDLSLESHAARELAGGGIRRPLLLGDGAPAEQELEARDAAVVGGHADEVHLLRPRLEGVPQVAEARLEEDERGRLVGEEGDEDLVRHQARGEPEALARLHVALVELEHALEAHPRVGVAAPAHERLALREQRLDAGGEVLLPAEALGHPARALEEGLRVHVARIGGGVGQRAEGLVEPAGVEQLLAPLEIGPPALLGGVGQDHHLGLLAPGGGGGVAGIDGEDAVEADLGLGGLARFQQRLAFPQVALDAQRALGGGGGAGRVVLDALHAVLDVALGAGIEGLRRLLGQGDARERLLVFARAVELGALPPQPVDLLAELLQAGLALDLAARRLRLAPQPEQLAVGGGLLDGLVLLLDVEHEDGAVPLPRAVVDDALQVVGEVVDEVHPVRALLHPRLGLELHRLLEAGQGGVPALGRDVLVPRVEVVVVPGPHGGGGDGHGAEDEGHGGGTETHGGV